MVDRAGRPGNCPERLFQRINAAVQATGARNALLRTSIPRRPRLPARATDEDRPAAGFPEPDLPEAPWLEVPGFAPARFDPYDGGRQQVRRPGRPGLRRSPRG